MLRSKIVSSTLYSQEKNIHWPIVAKINPYTLSKMKEVESVMFDNLILSGYQIDFLKSEEYQQAVHDCDLVSGKYHKMLGNYVFKMCVDQKMILEGNFETYPDRDYIVIPPVYHSSDKTFKVANKDGKVFCLQLSDVEDYANTKIKERDAL